MKQLALVVVVGAVVGSMASRSDAGVKTVTVRLEDMTGSCTGTLYPAGGGNDGTPGGIVVSKKSGDMILWSFENTCRDPQPVKICFARMDKPKIGKPMRKCVGPVKDDKVHETVTLAPGTTKAPSTASIACRVDWGLLEKEEKERSFWVYPVNGVTAQGKCEPLCVPSANESCQGGSELVLEVDP